MKIKFIYENQKNDSNIIWYLLPTIICVKSPIRKCFGVALFFLRWAAGFEIKANETCK